MTVPGMVLALAAAPVRAELAYTVHSDVAAGRFSVAVCSDAARARLALSAGRGADRFLRLDAGSGLALDHGRLLAQGLAAGECVRYRVDAAALAGDSRRGRQAAARGAWLLPPARWLWRPRGEAVRVRFQPAPGQQVSTPWPWRAANTITVPAGGRLSPALAAFGAVDERVFVDAGRWLRVAVVGAPSPQRSGALHAWIASVARAVPAVHGALPLPDAQVLVVAVPGRGRDPVPWGQSARGGAAAVHLYVADGASPGALAGDWVATHELMHLFHPYLGDRGRWLSEGLASYYQNVPRARSGAMDEAEAWRRLHAGFVRGRRDVHALPLATVSARMGGLGATMRTYWSGAAFWLRADVALRQRGDSLDAVLGRFSACCLPQRGRWTPERFVAELDRLAGGDAVFGPLYAALSGSHAFPSLARVYALLGLREAGQGLVFADGDAAVALRRAIMQGP